MNSVGLLIIGMMVVTYIPRLLPFILISSKSQNKYLKRFLNFIPYTALGALILPGILYAIPEKPIAGIIGILFVIIWVYIKDSIILPVLGSVLVTYLFIIVG